METIIMISVGLMTIGVAMAVLVAATGRRSRPSRGTGDSSVAWVDTAGGSECDSGASDGGGCDAGGSNGGGGGGD